MTPTFTVVLPTLARPTLARALASVRAQQLLPGDEVIVVGDGHRPEAERVFAASGLPGRYLAGPETPPGVYAGGGRQRTAAQALARTTHLLFLDDDDVFTPGAFAAARAAAATAGQRALVFKVWFNEKGRFVWADREARHGNVTTVGLCVPARPDLPAWGTERSCDWAFLSRCLPLLGAPVFEEAVIACTRPA